MNIPATKKVLLFSTLNPYPFWAGSENLWFDFVKDERINKEIQFHIFLADSPVTRKKAAQLTPTGIAVDYYKHFNTNFTRRNIYRISDRINRRANRTLPWYDEIKKNKYDLVWFNVAALNDLQELSYAVQLCNKTKIPYWIILQHGYEDFFLHSEEEIKTVIEVATSAKRFVFISKRNRFALERAIGQKMANAFHSVNAIPDAVIRHSVTISQSNKIGNEKTAKFFNLGRFSPKDKAQHLLLEALSGEQWKERDWQLSFIGVSGFGQGYLEKLIQFYNIDPTRIKIISHTDKVQEEIAKHDVLLMPSISEGTPFAMVESMACCRPAMGTPVGGIPELIIENETGWLCNSTDSKDIAEKLEEVWEQRSKWEQYGLAAQKNIAENYNQQTSFIQLLKQLTEDIK